MGTKSDGIRAVRNNNPGNIEKNPEWQGLMPLAEMTDAQRNEPRFAVFKSPIWGFRAMQRNLITYQDKRRAADGSVIDSIREAITRWAPPTRKLPDGTVVKENDTEAYIKRVCKLTGRQDAETIDFHKYEDSAPIVKAIATVECGGWFFDDKDLEAGLRLAGVPPPVKELVQSRTVQAATVATAATSISIVADNVKDVVPVTNLIREVAEYAPTVAGVLVLGVLVYIVYCRFDDMRREKR